MDDGSDSTNISRQSVITNNHINIDQNRRFRLEERDAEHLETRSRHSQPNDLQRFALEGWIGRQPDSGHRPIDSRGAGTAHRMHGTARGTPRSSLGDGTCALIGYRRRRRLLRIECIHCGRTLGSSIASTHCKPHRNQHGRGRERRAGRSEVAPGRPCLGMPLVGDVPRCHDAKAHSRWGLHARLTLGECAPCGIEVRVTHMHQPLHRAAQGRAGSLTHRGLLWAGQPPP
jgi:hypothetical protein